MQLGEVAGEERTFIIPGPKYPESPWVLSPQSLFPFPHTCVCSELFLTHHTQGFCQHSGRHPQRPATFTALSRVCICPVVLMGTILWLHGDSSCVSLSLLPMATTKFTPKILERNVVLAELSCHITNSAISPTHFNFRVLNGTSKCTSINLEELGH